ncbi:hypothetical protein [Nocardioides alkalitolerans]|uniref:hypothetical protein n=1 Tax=Nocardioides alkalitolerans TaxID=281714 RepID=UPI00041975B3|nr:hypothetical protein [Nocardioides alkalitolerans]
MKRPGESAALYVDMVRSVEPGDYIVTGTGRTYLVDAVRVQERGKHVGRQHLTTVVMEPGHEPEADATVHRISWYRRPRSRSTR